MLLLARLPNTGGEITLESCLATCDVLNKQQNPARFRAFYFYQ